MITTTTTAYKLLSPNEDGRHYEVYGYAATMKLAKEWAAKGAGWPRSYVRVNIKIAVAETLEEVNDSTVEV